MPKNRTPKQKATVENVGDLFDGVLIEVHDPEGVHSVPGWRCKRCWWTVGSRGLPPEHACPDKWSEFVNSRKYKEGTFNGAWGELRKSFRKLGDEIWKVILRTLRG